jgi:serine/threonine-protein kinase
VITNQAGIRVRLGDFEGGRLLLEKAALLLRRSIGIEHPDYANGLSDIAYVLVHAGRPAEALAAANQSVEIFLKYSDPDVFTLGLVYSNQGEAFNALGKYVEAETAFKNALQIFSKNAGPMHPESAFAIHGLGESRLAQDSPAAAARLFEDALRIRQQPHADPVVAADTEFGLARALWDSGGDRTRARSLATAALKAYQGGRRSERQRAVETWLADHVRPGPIRHRVSAL